MNEYKYTAYTRDKTIISGKLKATSEAAAGFIFSSGAGICVSTGGTEGCGVSTGWHDTSIKSETINKMQ